MELIDTDAIVETLKSVAQPVRLILFAGFVTLGLSVRFSPPKWRRRSIQLFLVYLLAVNGFVAVAGTDGWPFSPYPMMAIDARDEGRVLNGLGFRVVDEAGSESKVDPLAFSPLYPQSVMGWLENHWDGLDSGNREIALEFLFRRVEAARTARLERTFFGNRHVLGPLAAPDTNLYWEPTPSMRRAVALRIYRFRWNPGELFEDPDAYSRELVAEYADRDATE